MRGTHTICLLLALCPAAKRLKQEETTGSACSLWSSSRADPAWPETKHGSRRPRQPILQRQSSFPCHVVRIVMKVMVSKLLVHLKRAVRVSGRGTVNKAACMRCQKINCGNWLWIKLTNFEKRTKINRVFNLKHDAVKYKWRRNVKDAEQREVELLS